VEVDGIVMNKLSINFFFVTADRYTTRAPRSISQVKMGKSKDQKSVFLFVLDLQKIFYVSCHAQKFHVTPNTYSVDSRPQNVRSIFQTKVITNTNQPEGRGNLLPYTPHATRTCTFPIPASRDTACYRT
jgi:hypothetical protein